MMGSEKYIGDYKEQDSNKPARVVLVMEKYQKLGEAHEEELGKLKGVGIIMTENSTEAINELERGAGITHVILGALSPFGSGWLKVAEAAEAIEIKQEKIFIICLDADIRGTFPGEGYVFIPRRNIGDTAGKTSYKKLLGL